MSICRAIKQCDRIISIISNDTVKSAANRARKQKRKMERRFGRRLSA